MALPFSLSLPLSNFRTGAAFVISVSRVPSNVADTQYMFQKEERRVGGREWAEERKEEILGPKSSLCSSVKSCFWSESKGLAGMRYASEYSRT